MSHKGFTLVEILIIIGLFAIISSFATINLLKPQSQVSVDTSTTTLVADLKQQQIKSMAGDTQGTVTLSSHGIYFESNRYTLFQGTSFTPGDSYNFVIDLEANITLSSITFPSSQIVFAKRSGEVTGFTAGSNSLVVRNNQSGEQKTVTINRYGAIVIN